LRIDFIFIFLLPSIRLATIGKKMDSNRKINRSQLWHKWKQFMFGGFS
jgi:hypothetical protein